MDQLFIYSGMIVAAMILTVSLLAGAVPVFFPTLVRWKSDLIQLGYFITMIWVGFISMIVLFMLNQLAT